MLTWEQLSRKEQLAATHYDYYKDVHGVRPRWINYDAMTEHEIEVMLDQLEAEAIVEAARQAEFERNAIARFEARVADLMSSGAKSREQAIAWIKQAEDAENEDDDYLCFLLGLPYRYFQ